MTIELRLSCAAHAVRETVALFIPGREPGMWLTEIGAWQTDDSSLRLLAIPSAGSDNAPSGVLVIDEADRSALATVQPVKATAWGVLAGRLYLPVEASIVPPVTDAELLALLPDDDRTIAAWHPRAGLVLFEPEEQFEIADLLRVDVDRDAQWDCAEPGVHFNDRLISLTADELPPPATIMAQSQDDIGTESGDLSELPPAPNEQRDNPLTKAAGAAGRTVLRMIKKIVDSVPATSATPTWVNAIEDWANRTLRQLTSGLSNRQLNELKRLLQSLDSDPDQGLRKALPLSDSGRGPEVAPGDRLRDRDVDFHLGRLSEGGPRAVWDIPYDIQLQLAAKYRALASRELQLGRFRRAAYIFGELLGDVQAAAQALEQGGHFLEAASLYREKAKQPREAARCLERGGLLHQAAEIYVGLSDFEAAARLFEKLQQSEDARSCWEKAVDRKLESHDYIRAAEITEDHLDNLDEAISLLDLGWTQAGNQSTACLQRWFDLIGEHGRHEAAAERIDRLRTHATHYRMTDIMPVLARTHERYPDRSIRHQSADVARVTVAERLPRTPAAEKESLLRMLEQFDTFDRLLKRDCQRAADIVREQARKAAPRRPKQEPRRPQKFGHKDMSVEKLYEARIEPVGGLRTAAVSTPRGLFTTCYSPNKHRFSVEHYHWDARDMPGERLEVSWTLPHVTPEPPILIPDPAASSVTVHVPGHDHLEERVCSYPEPGFRAAGTERFANERTLTACGDSGRLIWHLATDRQHIWLETIDRRTGHVASVADLTAELLPAFSSFTTSDTLTGDHWQYRSTAGHRCCFVALGPDLFVVGPHLNRNLHLTFDSPIIDLAISAPLTRRRLAVSTENGIYLLADSWETQPGLLTRELSDAKIGFTRSGRIVAADWHKYAVIDTATRSCVTGNLTPSRTRPPIGVVATARPDVFAVVASDGTVTGYRVIE